MASGSAVLASAAKRVACIDSAERERQVVTYLTDNRIVLIPPPGEAAQLTSMEARELAQHLIELAEHADEMPPASRVIPFRNARALRGQQGR